MQPVQKLRPIMFAGTGSDVGKSVIAAAFCRIFLQDGYHPAPFKAQNMALNSYATPDGKEIGRAQAVQAEAAGIACSTDMNPLLLKPCTDQMAQVVLNGKPVGNRSAFEQFSGDRDYLRREVCAAFDRLAAAFHPVVMEGAGSISEINLKDRDIVNLPMALHAGADVILVADIDRGGVIASLYGSILLLDEQERKRVKGILINKFRGDLRLFQDGVRIIEQLCGIPVIGVVPYFDDIFIEEEDSVMLRTKNRQAAGGKVNMAVVLLRHMSNFTDFHLPERDPRVHLYYTRDPQEIEKADVVILPGSKSTIADLMDLRKEGIAASVLKARENGATVMGICGGYQMMGQRIGDPNGIEGNIPTIPGLGLLPVETVIGEEKVTRQTGFTFTGSDILCRGYEIHMGKTRTVDNAPERPLARLLDGTTDGYFTDSGCMGTYLHGILDNAAFLDFLISAHTGDHPTTTLDATAFKELQYDKLADHVRRHVNMSQLYEILTSPES